MVRVKYNSLINNNKDIFTRLKIISDDTDSNCMADNEMKNNDFSRDTLEPVDSNMNMPETTGNGSEHNISATVESAEGVPDLSEHCKYEDLKQPYTPDRRMQERDEANRREHARIGFTYPLELKLFASQLNNTTFNGYIEDISESGAGIKFDDKYGRVQCDILQGRGAKLFVRMPHGDDIALLSTIRWIKRDKTDNRMVKVGIEFQRLEDWQLKTVKQLISLKNKDQNMMWNLFENYEKMSGR